MRRPLTLLAGVLVALILGTATLPTGASWTSARQAASTSSGPAQWCAVPDASRRPNVYPLAEFGPILFGTSRMIIVPVVNNGEFGPAGAPRDLGVRLWACRTDLPSAPSVKVTAWRRQTIYPNSQWLAPKAGQERTFAGQRLDPELVFTWGRTLRDLHRNGSGGSAADPRVEGTERTQLSWVVGSGRTKAAPDALSQPCGASFLCSIPIHPAPSWGQAFRPEGGLSVPSTNGVTYWATKYWTGTGQSGWPLSGTPVATRLQLDPYQATAANTPPFTSGTPGPASENGRQVAWVVMEWWGGTPTPDMAIEVFLQ